MADQIDMSAHSLATAIAASRMRLMTAYGTEIFSMSDLNRFNDQSPYFDRPFMFFP
jgi:hypothetical protein